MSVAGWLYSFAWAATLAGQLAGLAAPGWAAGLAMIGFLAIELRRQAPAVRRMSVGLTALGVLGALSVPDPVAVLLAAIRQGAAYAAFFFALGALREAARGSETVRRCGAQLAAQPAGRRGLALLGGAHLFGLILSYGAIELLGAMLARAGVAGRRPMMAIFRGFALTNCWNPLNIMTAVVSASIPAAEMQRLIPWAFACAMAMLAVAALVDHRTGEENGPAAEGEGWSVHLRILALVALVMALAEGAGTVFGISLSTGVTLAVPLVALGWSAVQELGRAGALAANLRGFIGTITAMRGEAAVLATGGFLGVALGGTLPTEGLAGMAAGLPGAAIPLLVAPLLCVTGLLGLNPIIVVALIGAALPDAAALGIAPSVLALACMLGWGVSLGVTPLSASALATARWAGSDPWTVTLRWNRGYAAVTLALAEIAIVLADFILR